MPKRKDTPRPPDDQPTRPTKMSEVDSVSNFYKTLIRLAAAMGNPQAQKLTRDGAYGFVINSENDPDNNVTSGKLVHAKPTSSRGAGARKRLSKSKIQKGSVWDEIADTIQYLLEKAGFAIGNMTGAGKNLSIDPRVGGQRTYNLDNPFYRYDKLLPISYDFNRLTKDDKYLREVLGKIARHYMDNPSANNTPNRPDSLLSDMIPSALSPASQEQYNSYITNPNTFTNSGYNPKRWKNFKIGLGLGSGATGAAIATADSLKEKTKSNSIANSSMYKHMDGKPQPLKYATPFKNKYSK